MLDANLPFYDLINEAIRLGGLSLEEISSALRRRCYSINKGTLSRPLGVVYAARPRSRIQLSTVA
jgi:hypothetical protein